MTPAPRLARLGAVLATLLAALLLGASPALAHPLGNFTTNTFSAVVVEPSAVRVEVVVDRAEIPTRQAFPTLDDRSGELAGGAETTAAQQCADVAAGAALSVGGRLLGLTVSRSELDFPPGVAGLRTARLTCSLDAVAETVGARVDYRLDAFADTNGWREVTAFGDGVSLEGADVPVTSVSDALRSYPQDQLDAPLDVRSASFAVASGTGVVTGLSGLTGDGPATALTRGADGWSSSFQDLVARDRLTAPFIGLAMGAALLLGGLHAFAPGHGKTVMAAYLVGQRGALRDACVIGASVTLTHTLGVLLLGVVLTVVGVASPERVYPWLGVASGLLLVGIGAALLHAARHRPAPAPPIALHARVPVLAGVREAPAHEHHHDHDHAHPHEHVHAAPEPHSHGLFSHTHPPTAQGSGLRGLLAVGFAGGLVPSPSALVVLLGGIALGRTWFGVLLVVLYGVGMALALVATGVLLVKARDRIDTLLRRRAAPRAQRVATLAALLLPVVTACLVVAVGLGLTARALAQL